MICKKYQSGPIAPLSCHVMSGKQIVTRQADQCTPIYGVLVQHLPQARSKLNSSEKNGPEPTIN